MSVELPKPVAFATNHIEKWEPGLVHPSLWHCRSDHYNISLFTEFQLIAYAAKCVAEERAKHRCADCHEPTGPNPVCENCSGIRCESVAGANHAALVDAARRIYLCLDGALLNDAMKLGLSEAEKMRMRDAMNAYEDARK